MLKFSSLDCFVNKLSVLVNGHRHQVQQTEIVCYDYCDASYVVKLVGLSFFFFCSVQKSPWMFFGRNIGIRAWKSYSLEIPVSFSYTNMLFFRLLHIKSKWFDLPERFSVEGYHNR